MFSSVFFRYSRGDNHDWHIAERSGQGSGKTSQSNICENRNPNCLFIDQYYEVQQAYQLSLEEDMYKRILDEYEPIKYNKKERFIWYLKYNYLFYDLYKLNLEIKIYEKLQPFKTTSIKLPQSAFYNILKFKRRITLCFPKEFRNPN